jgi:2-polyprenyl-6-methoxyphenol hydroxylase-like FAD-dependent oxidoreductase
MTMPRPTHALVIGGGIAGTTAAMALQRAGIAATIYEAYPTDAGGAGVFLTVAVNGLAALRTIELEQPVKEAGFPSPSIQFASGTGKALGRIPLGGTSADETPAHTIRRPDLYRVLYEQAHRRGIRIEHGKRLVAAEPTPTGGVVARFEDGSSARGDVLIGADGIHSRTRRIIDPAAPRPRYSGLGNVGGYSRASISISMPGVQPGTYVMLFGKRAFFGYVLSPAGEVWWFANPPTVAELSRAELTAAPGQWQQRLLELFAGDAGPAADIIRQAETLAVTNQHDLPRVPAWWRGGMVIIGDAAHAASPSSGQGASLAIEDGVVLAQCLRDLPDPAAAFAAFEQLRRPRVERIVAWAARMNQTKTPGPVARVVRDLVLPVLLRRAGQSQEWIFKYRIDWEAPVRMPQAA